jgi:hypothetical protein
MEASKIQPVPLFEALNDPQGRRYVVGEGGYVDEEGGEYYHYPSVMVMEPVDPAELDALPVEPETPVSPRPVVSDDLSAQVASVGSEALIAVGFASGTTSQAGNTSSTDPWRSD